MALTVGVALTNALICVFAMSSWLTVSGLWVEVPLFVKRLPEGISLPSYLVLTIQLANIGPICYGLVNTYVIPKALRKKRAYECCTVFMLLVVGLVSCLLLISLWNRVTVVRGVPHSVALFSLTTIMAIVDCTSSVIFLPFMARYPSHYMTSFYFGEGLSGLVPGLAGIIQGEEHSTNVTSRADESSSIIRPRIEGLNFSLETFFIFLALIVFLSGLAFLCLNIIPMCRELQVEPYDTINDERVLRSDNNLRDFEDILIRYDSDTSSESELLTIRPPNNRRGIYILLVIILWINCLGNGFLPSLQSFACLPYGLEAYSYAVKLSIVVTPVAPLFMLRFKCNSDKLIVALTVVVSLTAAYVIFIASQSHSFLQGTRTGAVLIVSSYIIITGISSFIKVNIASILSETRGYRELFWCGALTQIGSFIGAVISYYLVNIAQVFHANQS